MVFYILYSKNRTKEVRKIVPKWMSNDRNEFVEVCVWYVVGKERFERDNVR